MVKVQPSFDMFSIGTTRFQVLDSSPRCSVLLFQDVEVLRPLAHLVPGLASGAATGGAQVQVPCQAPQTCRGVSAPPESRMTADQTAVTRLMDKILHDLKDPKLWELWYIPYYG